MLKQHILRNSWKTHPNEIIGISGNIIQSYLVKNINKSDRFEMLGDKTMDVAGK